MFSPSPALALVLVASMSVAVLGGPTASSATEQGPAARTEAVRGGAAGEDADPLAGRGWVWPVSPVRVVRSFEAPAHAYAPGHRGIDLIADAVRSPADGRIAFAGPVAGRDVVTIDHGDGVVTTFEPVETVLGVGDPVRRGDAVGTVSAGGHTTPGTVHMGVRLDGAYINPLRLLGGVPRAILLPCC